MPISKTPTRGIFPVDNTHQAPGTVRYEAMVTPEIMKQKSLFGIPLTSSLTQQTISDDTLQMYINEAISELEHMLDLYITPVHFCERHDYIRHQFTWSYNYTKLDHPNVLSIDEVAINFDNSPDSVNAINFPLEFVSLHQTEGAIQLVPAFGTSFSGFLLSAMSGTQFYALQNAVQTGKFPDAVRISYTCGFEPGKIPAAIVALVETMAAIRILSMFGPILFPYNSVAVSIDGTSQSSGNAGVNFLALRLKDLGDQRDRLLDAVKGYYQRKFLVDWY